MRRILTSLLLACALLSATPAHASLFGISPEKERKIGQDAAQEIEKSAFIVSGPVEEWEQRIGARLADKSDPEFHYTFHVVDSPEINAFCLPGGHVYVYTGLRKVVRTDDELASILAHEITHAEQHHYARQYAKDSKRGAIVGLGSLLLGLPGLASQSLELLSYSVGQRYSRDHEYEADRLGLERMKRAGFDPNAMVTVLQRLSDDEDRDGLDQWLADHPEGKKRVAAIKAQLAGP